MKKSRIFSINVLAVDDQPANLVALEAVLANDCNLVFANSGQEAISILEKNSDIHIILMDLQMPEMDGFETARRIKSMEGCRDIPIIFITAIYKEDPFVRRGYEVGGVDYFSKPFDPEILRKKVAIYSSFRHKAGILKTRENQIRETEELLKAGRRLSAVLENLPVGVLIADTDGSICQSNEAVSKIINSTEPIRRDSYGEILGWWDLTGKKLKNSHGALAKALNEGISSHNQRTNITCFDGSEKTVLVSTAPLYGLENQIVGAVIIIQDVTEPKKIEEDLENRITRLVSLGIELEQSLKH